MCLSIVGYYYDDALVDNNFVEIERNYFVLMSMMRKRVAPLVRLKYLFVMVVVVVVAVVVVHKVDRYYYCYYYYYYCYTFVFDLSREAVVRDVVEN